MEYSLKDLEKEAEEQRETMNSYLREGYQFARKLGFSSSEATILKGKGRDVTIRLAIERGYIKDINDPLIIAEQQKS